jgi:hypothetical protein
MRRLIAAFIISLGLASAALAQQPSFTIRTLSGSGAVVTTAQPGTLIWVGTTPASWAITLPSNPSNGTYCYFTTDTTLGSIVTITAASGDTLVAAFASQPLTANTTIVGWQFYSPTRTWYRIQ